MWTVIDSPIGPLRLVAQPSNEADHGTNLGAPATLALTAIEFSPVRDPAPEGHGPRVDDEPLLRAASTQLREYFDGARTEFDLPLAPAGTPFQQEVWAALQLIGWGETISYGTLAQRLGRTAAASRAVGLANGRNPIPIIIPCHRVIGTNGTLTGYAGGVARKQHLLELEADRRDLLF